MHLHDNGGRSDEHLEVGKGTIDWKEVMAGLRGFKGRMVVEARTIEEGTASLKVLEGLAH